MKRTRKTEDIYFIRNKGTSIKNNSVQSITNDAIWMESTITIEGITIKPNAENIYGENENLDNGYLNNLTPTGRSFLRYRRKWAKDKGDGD